MTAHDDDQDLVTIRVPRRAAAIYAAELDLASSPLAVALTSYSQFGAGFISVLISLAFWIAAVINLLHQTLEILPLLIVSGTFSALMGVAFLTYAARFRRALRRRSAL